jgi:hypothetical protein
MACATPVPAPATAPVCPSGQFLTSDGGLVCAPLPAPTPLPGCASGEYITSDGGASLLCSALPAAPAPTYPSCPSGQYLTSDGGLICAALPAAPAAAKVVRTTANIPLPPSTQATPIDLTGLTWSVAAGTQSSFECFLPTTVTGATNGPRFTLALASATDVRIQAVEFRTTAIAAVYEMITATGTFTAAVTSGATAGASSMWQLRGTLTAPASASTAQIRGMASNGADAGVGNGLVVLKGAWCWYY